MRTCSICGYDKFEDIWKIPQFPVFMGATFKYKSECVFEDLEYIYCLNCHNLQIRKLLSLKLLYQNNHNIDVVGKIWEEHHFAFAKFIEKHQPNIVAEIGAPTPKIYNHLKNNNWLKKWYSIEPNPDYSKISGNFLIIKDWLNRDFSFAKWGFKPNAIVMSHVFEHFHNPTEILNTLYSQLVDGDELFISIPNMEYISRNHIMPPSGIHFEHTFYVDLENIEYLLLQTGFAVIDKVKFQNHSLFIRAIKVNFKAASVPLFIRAKNANTINLNNFSDTIGEYKEIVNTVNNKIKKCPPGSQIYLYGAHFSAQFLLFSGLDELFIHGVLDQSPSKIGKKLYGTHLKISNPQTLRDKWNVCEIFLICYMGTYTEEIKNNLLFLNPQITFL